MLTRQSNRRSADAKQPLTRGHASEAGPELKKRKIHAGSMPSLSNSPPLDDKIDPVEKLLSFSHVNTDILSLMNESEQQSPVANPVPVYPNISCNFKKALHENMRLYYSKFGKSHMDIHNDHSSFSVLNEPPQAPLGKSQEQHSTPRYTVPFFRNVNFNPTPTFNQIEDYIYYDDDESHPAESDQDELSSPTSVVETPIPSLSGKMSFHYRQNDKLDLSLTASSNESSNDIFKFLNKRSVLSGKASEMIGTANFLVSDFFF